MKPLFDSNHLYKPFCTTSLILLLSLLPTLRSYSLSPEDKTLYEKLRTKLHGQGDYIEKHVSRSKHLSNTVELESFISQEADLEVAQTVLKDTKEYRRWALKQINIRPDGGTYRIRVDDLLAHPRDPNRVTLHYAIDLLMFKLKGKREFSVNANIHKDVTHIFAHSLPKQRSLIKEMNVSLKMFPSTPEQKHIWLYLKAYVTLSNPLLFEALLQKLLNNEFNRRIHRVLENYTEEENKRFDQAL